MKMLRVFIKPDGRIWFDFPLPEGGNCATAYATAVREGIILSTETWVPFGSILYAHTWEPNVKPQFIVQPPPGVQ